MSERICPYCAEVFADAGSVHAQRCTSCGEALFERTTPSAERPGVVIAFAVINATLGLVALLLGLGLAAVLGVAGAADGVLLVVAGASLGMLVVLVVSAVGLWRLAPWGRTLALCCSCLLGVVATLSALRFGVDTLQRSGDVSFTISTIGWLPFAAVYFAFQYVVLLKPDIARAFRREVDEPP